MKFKKIVVLYIFIVILSTFLTGCTNILFGTSAKDYIEDTESENKLNLFIWSEYIPDSIIEQFEQKYNIKVNYITYSSNEEMLAKIMAGNETYDISVASDYMVDVMRKQKLLEELDLTNIPSIKNIGNEFKNMYFDQENKYSVPYMWGNAVIVVNTSLVSKDIKSYSDLWDESLKNSLVVLDDERAIIGIALKKLGYSMNEIDPQKLSEARLELLKLKANIKKFDSDSPSSVMINKEASVGYMWGAEAYMANKANSSIKVVFPTEGMYIWQDNFVIPKGAMNKKNAELFMNYILDPNVSASITNEYPYANPNTAARQFIDKNILNSSIVYPKESDLKIGEHLKDLEDATRLYDKIWAEFK